MMRGTASAQISIDYFSQEDCVRKMRAAYILGPAIKLLTDCTPVFEGQPAKGHLTRTAIWRDVDPKTVRDLSRPVFGRFRIPVLRGISNAASADFLCRKPEGRIPM